MGCIKMLNQIKTDISIFKPPSYEQTALNRSYRYDGNQKTLPLQDFSVFLCKFVLSLSKN